MKREVIVASVWGLLFTIVLAGMIVIGSRNLSHFDAALVGYTFAVLFATFGIVYRYAMWLQRPPTAMYWKRGWQVFLRPLIPCFKYGELDQASHGRYRFEFLYFSTKSLTLARSLADHVGLHRRGAYHLSASVWMAPF